VWCKEGCIVYLKSNKVRNHNFMLILMYLQIYVTVRLYCLNILSYEEKLRKQKNCLRNTKISWTMKLLLVR